MKITGYYEKTKLPPMESLILALSKALDDIRELERFLDNKSEILNRQDVAVETITAPSHGSSLYHDDRGNLQVLRMLNQLEGILQRIQAGSYPRELVIAQLMGVMAQAKRYHHIRINPFSLAGFILEQYTERGGLTRRQCDIIRSYVIYIGEDNRPKPFDLGL